ncbi:fimbrial protein [Enterobacter roggenkampii]|uniref:fimbrial protein n=1 Tax=Enterobacter roggenkampii TaxID=1812935 RepID=UPI001237E5FC|nr:fimbrial protein [Enterobacter roggenkampii]
MKGTYFHSKALFLMLILGLFSTFSHAENCSITEQTDTVQFDNIIAQRDAPVGTVLATRSKTFSLSASGTESTCAFYYTMYYNSAIGSGTDHVYKTNIPGVGIKVQFGDYAGWHTADVPATKGREFYGATFLTGWIVDLIKIGDITSGTLQDGKVATAQFTLTPESIPNGVVTVNLTSSSVTQVLCSVKTNALLFPIGDVQASEFTQKGATSSETASQNLDLDCDENANINVTLSGTQNPDSTDSSVLALSQQGQQGVAEGVGVQLFYNDKALKLNELLNLKKSVGGPERFTLTARYIQTKDTVSPGKANATATLNLTYQ